MRHPAPNDEPIQKMASHLADTPEGYTSKEEGS